MTPDDLSRLNTPSDPRIGPDGHTAVFVVSTPNIDEDQYDKQIWISDLASSHRLTDGPGDTAPRWSPDGTQLAFLRKGGDDDSQLAVMSVGGGEPKIITSFDHGVETLEWSPDGSTIAVVAVTDTEEWADLDDDERNRRPRRVTSVPYRFDARGWTHDRKRHVWLIDPTGHNEPRCLTPGDHDEEFPAWSPDGKKLALISARDPQRGLISGNEVLEVDALTCELTTIARLGFWSAVSYSPSGVLHLLGSVDPGYPVDAYLHRLEPDGSLTNLTSQMDRSSVSLAAGAAGIAWDNDDPVVGFEDSGTFGVIRVTARDKVETVIDGQRIVTGFDVSAGRAVFTASVWNSPGELFLSTDGREAALTDLNHDDLDLIQPEHFRVISDGQEIDAWALIPPGEGTLPLLLNIHGGPASQYGFGFFDEFQVYASAGYGVVACNPRGSSGRGSVFTRAVVGEGWGVVDVEDIRSVVKAAIDRFPRFDPDRMGIMGGSYGGFMTAWMIGQEDRWKSAVVERALSSFTSFAGTSDIGGAFPVNYLVDTYPDAWDLWWRKSPMSIVDQVKTPTLIIHSEDDFRCPIEQGEQYFMALLRNGTPVEMLRFPDEGHEMSRSGKPLHRKERFEAVLDWHHRHLS